MGGGKNGLMGEEVVACRWWIEDRAAEDEDAVVVMGWGEEKGT